MRFQKAAVRPLDTQGTWQLLWRNEPSSTCQGTRAWNDLPQVPGNQQTAISFQACVQLVCR